MSFFFPFFLFLGSLFAEKFSGANFCFWVSVSFVFILVLFCLCFCFIIWFFVPANVSRKFFSRQVRCLNKFSGANFCFWVSGVGFVCFGAVLPMFLLYIFVFSLPKLSQKNSLDVRSGVFGSFSLFLWFFCRRRRPCFFFFFREKDQVVTGHTPTRTWVAFSCSFFVPPHLFVRPFWPCVPLLGVFSGCHSGPRAFLGFSWNLRGLSSLAPSEALFLDARRQGCFGRFFLLFLFSPSVVFCGFFTHN